MSGPEAKRAVEEAPRRLRQALAEIERLRAALANIAKRLKTGYEPGCDCSGCQTMRYAEKALIGVAVETSASHACTDWGVLCRVCHKEHPATLQVNQAMLIDELARAGCTCPFHEAEDGRHRPGCPAVKAKGAP